MVKRKEQLQNNPSHELITAYLTIDIQKSPKGVEELLQKIKAVRSGQIPSWERIGNAYCLRLFPNHIEIEADYPEDTGSVIKIPINDFESAVTAWQEVINR